MKNRLIADTGNNLKNKAKSPLFRGLFFHYTQQHPVALATGVVPDLHDTPSHPAGIQQHPVSVASVTDPDKHETSVQFGIAASPSQ